MRLATDAARPLAAPEDIESALDALESAENPLVIVGKGMAWSQAEGEVREFIERTQLPFLASPMGKGVMPDDDPLSVGAARSTALREACLLYTSPSPRDRTRSRMPSSA